MVFVNEWKLRMAEKLSNPVELKVVSVWQSKSQPFCKSGYIHMRRSLIWLINLYRLISRLVLPHVCRFYPSCSFYTIQAIQKHGSFYGSCLGLKRILKCHPFNKGGVDPVRWFNGKKSAVGNVIIIRCINCVSSHY